MIKSMTGYGKGAAPYGEGECVVEVRSLNHRFLSVGVQCPRALLSLEHRIKKVVEEEFERGHIDVYIIFPRARILPTSLRVNTALAEQYVKALRNLGKSLALEGEVTLDLVSRLREVVSFEEEALDGDELWGVIEPALRVALEEVSRVRAMEGANLHAELRSRLEAIQADVAVIEKEAASLPAQWHERLRRRAEELAAGLEVDRCLLEQEVALHAERSDVSEEITRLRSHVESTLKLLDLEEPVGRQLDFYIQEMHREANTLGAKAGSLQISQRVVAVKSELEKMRQQVQNVE